MSKRTLFALSLLLFYGSMYVSASPGISFSLNSIKTNSDIIAGLPLPAGADLALEIPLGSMTSLTLRGAAGYESRMILRDTTTSVPIAEPATIDGTNRFYWTKALAEIGLRQYLIRDDDAAAWLFGLVRGRYESNATSFPTTLFTDAQNIESVSGTAGIAFDSSRWREINRKTGTYAELSVEYSPQFASFTSTPTNYGRANLTAEAFIPLSAECNTLRNPSLIAPYLVLYGAGDYAAGSAIPQEVLTSFGGLVGTEGIGDMVRGAQSWGYESPAKAYASAELRVAGPSLFKNLVVYPVGYIFADAAGYAGLYGSPNGSSLADNSGVFASTGAGVSLSVLNFLWLGAYAGWRWPIHDPLAPIYYSSPQGFFWNFTFVAHY
ncbi:exported hypothetical protein [uncultured spirochete]|uniref:Uncharacterized protein n=1 Tax=uncultured spirochete TaxID=156406 RepID=A0A3P3XQC0_9SPIR|nr:exported hypothetical protein [uncultured spirochete]